MPYLYYSDASEALEFLQQAFGFEEHAVTRDDDGIVWTAQLRTGSNPDSGLVMIGPGMTEFGSRAAADADLASCRVHVLVADLEDHFRRAVAAGAMVVTEPTDGFGGMRLYVAKDCGGQQWIFAQADDTASAISAA